jgi:hypothetical protein
MAEQAEKQAPPPSIEDRIQGVLNIEAAPEPEAPKAEAPKAEAPQAALQAAPQVEAPEPETPPAEKAEAETPPAEQVEEVELTTLDDLAGHIGCDVKDLYGLKVGVTNADGTAGEITLSEWKDGYQAADHFRAKETEIAELRANFERESTQAREQITQNVQHAHGLLEAAEKQLMGDMDKVDWNQLRAEDPAEYAARRAEFGERQSQITSAKYAIAENVSRQQQEQTQAQQAQLTEVLKRERDAMLIAMPEWRDAAKFEKARNTLTSYLSHCGFSHEEISTAVDHRLLIGFEKARLWDDQLAQTKMTAKKVVKIASKVLKPGAKQSKDVAAADRTSASRAKLRKSGKLDDAAAFFKDIGLGDPH